MVIRAFLWKKARHDKKHNIKIYIYDSDKKIYVTTTHFVCKEHWDKSTRTVSKDNKNHEYINNDIKGKIYDLQRKYLIDPLIKINDITEVKKKKVDFNSFLQASYNRLENKTILTKNGQSLSTGSIKGMKTHLHRIIEYNKIEKITFDKIDIDFYGRFVSFLRYEYKLKLKKKVVIGLSENSISKTVSNFVRIVKDAWKAKLHDNRGALNFSVPRVESDNIALSEKEIDSMMAIKNLPEHLVLESDRFYVAYNFFLRFGDSIVIDKANILTINNKKYLESTSGKTHTKVIIPIFKRTLAILKKYNYEIPKTTNQESNWKIKEIGRLAGIDEPTTVTEIRQGKIIKTVYEKYKLITTHTARRSMATNLYMSGVDRKSIQLMGGWKTLDMLETYLKIDKVENAINVSKHPFFAKRK